MDSKATSPTPQPAPAREGAPPASPKKRAMPILVRHAVSLSVIFVIAITLSYVIGTRVYRDMQLDQLTHTDEEVFEDGLAYVYENAAEDEVVTQRALEACETIPPRRAAILVLAVIDAHAQERGEVPDGSLDTVGSVIARNTPGQSIVLYKYLLDYADQGLIDTGLLRGLLMDNINVEGQDDRAFLHTIALLDRELLWTRSLAQRDHWIRWLLLLAEGGVASGEQEAVRQLGELPGSVDDPRVVSGLDALADSDDVQVRLAVLHACAGYAAIAESPFAYEQVIFDLTDDPDPGVARRAWLVVGHLNPYSGYAANWEDAEPEVAEAMLWASVMTNPDAAPIIYQAHDSGLQRECAYAMYQIDHPPVVGEIGPKWTRIIARLETVPLVQSDLLLLWRYLPNLHTDWQWLLLSYIREDLHPNIYRELGRHAVRNGPYAGIIEATVYYARWGYQPEDPDELRSLYIAWLEGLEDGPVELTGEIDVPIYYEEHREVQPNNVQARDAHASDWPIYFTYDYSQLPNSMLNMVGERFEGLYELAGVAPTEMNANLWVAVTYADHGSEPPQFVLDEMHGYLRGYGLYERTTAALYAGMAGLEPTLISGVTADLLRENPDLVLDELHAMPDAELAELGLERVDALSALLEGAENATDSPDAWLEVQLLRLALWMRGDLGNDFTPTAEAMLFDPRLPTTTVLMCLLHMQRPIALEFLFGDSLGNPPDLNELMLGQRWWHIYSRFVDCTDTPLWVWGDPGAQAFQFDSMRQWYAVNRWRLHEEGWWPEPVRE